MGESVTTYNYQECNLKFDFLSYTSKSMFEGNFRFVPKQRLHSHECIEQAFLQRAPIVINIIVSILNSLEPLV